MEFECIGGTSRIPPCAVGLNPEEINLLMENRNRTFFELQDNSCSLKRLKPTAHITSPRERRPNILINLPKFDKLNLGCRTQSNTLFDEKIS